MPSFSSHKARIYELAPPHTLLGTIDNVIAAEGNGVLDGIGGGWFSVHGSDTPSVSLLDEYLIARVTAVSAVTGLEHEICCIIIQNIKPVTKGAYVTFRVSGPDLLGELRFQTIGFNLISDNAAGPTATAIADTLLLSDLTWTQTVHGTLSGDGGYFIGSGESPHMVLLAIMQQMQAHFSIAQTGNPSLNLHVWHENTALSGTDFDDFTLIETTNPASYQATPSTVIISKNITIVDEPQEVVTRAHIFGAGMGVDRFTMADAQGLVTIPTGYSVDWVNSVIINTALEASQPKISRTKQFSSFRPEDPTSTTARQTVAKLIFAAGIFWMGTRSYSNKRFYKIPSLIMHGNIIPGQLVRVTYNRSSPVDAAGSAVTTEILNLDDDLMVLEVRHKIGKDGNRYTDLLVGSVLKGASAGDSWLANKLLELEELVAHANAGSGGIGGGGGGGSSSYLLAAGSPPNLSGNLLVDAGVTIDGVDISAHAADFDPHHVPGTISVSTSNFNDGTEYHAVDASSNPGSQTYLLKTDASGKLVLVRADLTSLVLTDRNDATQYNIFIENGRMYIEPV